MNQNNLKLGFSPCPNDTFIFDALYHNKIDNEGLQFEWIIEDVEELNRRAFDQSIDITKISYYSFAQLIPYYQMMRSGGALGFNCGPLLVANKAINLDELVDPTIAIPGKNTTANLLCSLAFPTFTKKSEVLFSDIENHVLDGRYDLGLIIHESRFTYESKGLYKVLDLGEFWESTTHSPIPLGGICINRYFPTELKLKVERLIKKSVEYAFKHPEDSLPFTKTHAQEMDIEVMQKHISLYVNDYSIHLGDDGIQGVQSFLEHLTNKKIIPAFSDKIFV